MSYIWKAYYNQQTCLYVIVVFDITQSIRIYRYLKIIFSFIEMNLWFMQINEDINFQEFFPNFITKIILKTILNQTDVYREDEKNVQ